MASRTSRSDLRRAVVLLCCSAAHCLPPEVRSEAATEAVPTLAGALSSSAPGRPFPPLYARWLSDLGRGGGGGGVKVAYQAVVSGAGVQRFMRHQVDFGAPDVAMTED
jgi:ABC-type phosphate transport system substrate-binding protein